MDNLTLLKCKNCGGELDVRLAVNGVIECEYCHTPWTVPKQETASDALKYLHDGNAALDVCNFEDAFTYFQKAAELDSKEPEAYFGMALANFKVQYLKDEVNNCLQPICHEISEKVFTEDKNYKRALELATVEQKKVYRRKGGEIDDIRDEFFALQNSGLTYDCFLCVKVTEEDGSHTDDYNRANDIYYHLKDGGYKPFFSEREMKGRTGSAYEALILYALYTSECMLIICSDESYLQTKWVKNEYTRFINLMQEGGKERDALTFVFARKPIEKLPNGKKIQGIDIAKPDAYSRITEYVESHTPAARKKREEGEQKKLAEELARRKAFEEQQKLLEEQKKELERLRKMQNGGGAANLSGAALLEALKQAQEEEARRQREEAEKKRQEEEALRRAQEEERKRWEASSAYLAQFEVWDGVLIKYEGSDRSVAIPEGVTSIGDWAFGWCEALTEVKIPEGVTSIGDSAFEGCTGFKQIILPESVVSIGANAFRECSGLDSIVIPDGVISIGESAFWGCEGLTEIDIPERMTLIGKGAFSLCTGLTEIKIPNSVTSIGKSAFADCYGLENVIIGEGVISIQGEAFRSCTNLKNVTIPKRFDTGPMHSNLKNIFKGCYKNIQFTFI